MTEEIDRAVRTLTPVEGPFGPRRLRVFVPGHDDAAVRPLLLLLDGQNVFGDEGSFAGGWHAHAAAASVVRRRDATAPVVAALDHGGERRFAEMSAWPVQGHAGEAGAFFAWVATAVLARLREEAGVVLAPERVFIGGSSMGGLGALYAHFAEPQAFGGALCMSPSFWVGDGAVLDWVAGRQAPPTSRIYLDCGVREGRGRVAVLAQRMAEHLAARGWGPERLRWRLDPKGAHNERSWRRRLPAALRFLVPRPR
jgi:predicted alpha/beta superfamily hydrolase